MEISSFLTSEESSTVPGRTYLINLRVISVRVLTRRPIPQLIRKKFDSQASLCI